jgi:hypothetical protein
MAPVGTPTYVEIQAPGSDLAIADEGGGQANQSGGGRRGGKPHDDPRVRGVWWMPNPGALTRSSVLGSWSPRANSRAIGQCCSATMTAISLAFIVNLQKLSSRCDAAP